MSTTVSAPAPDATAPKRPLTGLAVRAAQIFLVLWAVFYLVEGVKAALWFTGDPFDGPFQIFNPLRRIAAGQIGGRDFVFFHGIGVPYLHYPLFVLFGKTLLASELSRQWTSLFLFALSIAAFAWATFRDTLRFSIASVCAVALLEITFPRSAAPGNSLIATRSAMPVLVFAALQLPIGSRAKAMLAGSGIGLAFVFGIEHGIFIAFALALVTIMLAASNLFWAKSEWSIALRNLEFAAIALVTACGAAGLLLFLMCGAGGVASALEYNLAELPADQFWLFGAPPMPILSSWTQLIFDHHAILCLLPAGIGLLLLILLIARFWRRPLRVDRDWPALAVLMLLYGMLTTLPMLGFLSRHYAFPMARVLVLLALLLWRHEAWPGALNRILQNARQHHKLAARTFAGACLVAAGALSFRTAVSATALIQHLRSPFLYSRFLDHRWDSFMAQSTHVIDADRQRSPLSLWSAYSALLEAHYGLFAPSSDYIIHSIGPRRWREYVQTFARVQPEFVTTLTTDFDFEEWLQNERWGFYEELLNNYNVLGRAQHALIWRRKAEAWHDASVSFQPLKYDRSSDSVELASAQGSARIAIVQVYYHVLNRWQWIPLLGKTPRYLATIEGSPRNLPVSFPPYASVFRFPVQLSPTGPVILRFETVSLIPGTAFQPDRVEFTIPGWRSSESILYARSNFSRARR